jgi:hypothetical protein
LVGKKKSASARSLIKDRVNFKPQLPQAKTGFASWTRNRRYTSWLRKDIRTCPQGCRLRNYVRVLRRVEETLRLWNTRHSTFPFSSIFSTHPSDARLRLAFAVYGRPIRFAAGHSRNLLWTGATTFSRSCLTAVLSGDRSSLATRMQLPDSRSWRLQRRMNSDWYTYRPTP